MDTGIAFDSEHYGLVSGLAQVLKNYADIVYGIRMALKAHPTLLFSDCDSFTSQES